MGSENSNFVRGLFHFLKEISVFSAEAERSLLSISTVTEVKKNKNLQLIGQICKTIYFVKSGMARIHYYNDGKDVTEYFAFNNDIIIRAESLFTGKPSRKAIQALEDTTFIGIPSNRLFGLFEEHRDVERLFRKIVEKAYVESINRMESLQFHSAEERYNDLLSATPDILLRIPLKHIASYLGITQVSLSRIRAKIS